MIYNINICSPLSCLSNKKVLNRTFSIYFKSASFLFNSNLTAPQSSVIFNMESDEYEHFKH